MLFQLGVVTVTTVIIGHAKAALPPYQNGNWETTYIRAKCKNKKQFCVNHFQNLTLSESNPRQTQELASNCS